MVEGPVDAINGFYGNNFKWLTVVTVTLTALYIWNQWRQGKTEIQSLTALEDELSAHRRQAEEVGEERKNLLPRVSKMLSCG